MFGYIAMGALFVVAAVALFVLLPLVGAPLAVYAFPVAWAAAGVALPIYGARTEPRR